MQRAWEQVPLKICECKMSRKTLAQNSKKSTQKDQVKRNRALLGKLKALPPNIRRFYELALPENAENCRQLFSPLIHSKCESELQKEEQTFAIWKVQRDFQRFSWRQRKRLKQRTICMQPLGPFPEFVFKRIPGLLDHSLFSLLRHFVELYFSGFSVRLLDAIDINELSCTTRLHKDTGKKQILVGDILSYLKVHRPPDTFCLVGITWDDLYPSEEWNFVLGESSFEYGAAVMSFGHYEPLTYKPDASSEGTSSGRSCLLDNYNVNSELSNGKTVNEDQNVMEILPSEDMARVSSMGILESSQRTKTMEQKPDRAEESGCQPSDNCSKGSTHTLQVSEGCVEITSKSIDLEGDCGITAIDAAVIWRFFRGISHEVGHVFGITHCVFHACAMNESSSIQEAESQPLLFCPVCLCKLQEATGFDLLSRYRELKVFLESLHGDLFRTSMSEDGVNKERGNVQASENVLKAIKSITLILKFLSEEQNNSSANK